jgi:hypothetical protein
MILPYVVIRDMPDFRKPKNLLFQLQLQMSPARLSGVGDFPRSNKKKTAATNLFDFT